MKIRDETIKKVLLQTILKNHVDADIKADEIITFMIMEEEISFPVELEEIEIEALKNYIQKNRGLDKLVDYLSESKRLRYFKIKDEQPLFTQLLD